MRSHELDGQELLLAMTAFDEPYEKDAAKPPISLHPAFPVIVALWFAALLGLGSLILPVVLLERAVEASGLAALAPAAAPPLGFTARGIVAVAAALSGGIIGIAIARRIAGAHRPARESRIVQLSNGSRRPISIKDEVGGDGVVNGESLPISRRRALAISQDDRPSDFLYQAPLPGEETDAPASSPEVAGDEPGADAEPLELSELAADPPEPTADEAQDAVNDEDIEMTESREFQPARSAQPFHAPERELSERDEDGHPGEAGASRDPEPLPFSPPSLARRSLEPATEAGFDKPAADKPDLGLASAVDSAATPDIESGASWETAPLEELGLVQLVQRLGSTIERRRDLAAKAARPEESAPLVRPAADIEAAPAEEAAQAMAAYFGSAAAEAPPPTESREDEPAPAVHRVDFSPSSSPAEVRPAFLHPFGAEDDDDDDEEIEDSIPDFTLPLRRSLGATSSAAAEDDSSEEFEEDGYSSLLGMSNPFSAPKHEAIRIEEPAPETDLAEPAVVFPGQEERSARLFDPPADRPSSEKAAAPTSPDADAALRAALATLQRMSGAA